MTPNAIEILIHCYVSPEPHPRRNAPVVINELESMEFNGLIESCGDHYKTTERGRVHVMQLCRTAWPIAAWVSADGAILSDDSLRP